MKNVQVNLATSTSTIILTTILKNSAHCSLVTVTVTRLQVTVTRNLN